MRLAYTVQDDTRTYNCLPEFDDVFSVNREVRLRALVDVRCDCLPQQVAARRSHGQLLDENNCDFLNFEDHRGT